MRLLIVAAIGCSTAPRGPTQVSEPPFEQHITNSLDVLFVIDNSASTSDKQTLFVDNFPRLVETLDAFPAGRPDLHIGVVTSTVDIGVQGFGPGCPSPAPNDNGLLVNAPRVATGCSGPTGRFLSDIASSSGARTTNYEGALADAFSCVAEVGATGCGFEAPLEAMKRALDGSRPENAGFLRADADLAIVILTDEDDASIKDAAIFTLPIAEAGPGDFRAQPLYAYACDQPISATMPGTYTGCVPATGGYLQDVGYYADFLATVKDPSQIALAVIGGPPSSTIETGAITAPFSQTLALEPSCSATIGGNYVIARPGIRLGDLVTRFGDRGRYESACQSDYTGAFADVGAMMFQLAGYCVASAIDTTDTDPDNPGIQPDCVVSRAGTVLPRCQMLDATTPAPGQPPCSYFTADPRCAAVPSGLAVDAVGGATTLDLSCVRALQ